MTENNQPLMVLPATDHLGGRARLMPVIGDGMAPTLRPGDFVAVVPADRYTGDGIYVIIPAEGCEPTLYRIGMSSVRGCLHVFYDNRAYDRPGERRGDHLPFDVVHAMIIGAVAATIHVSRPSLLEGIC